MAINRLQYPIDFDEAMTVVKEIADEILADNRQQIMLGDSRPEVLYWVVEQLARLKSLEK